MRLCSSGVAWRTLSPSNTAISVRGMREPVLAAITDRTVAGRLRSAARKPRLTPGAGSSGISSVEQRPLNVGRATLFR